MLQRCGQCPCHLWCRISTYDLPQPTSSWSSQGFFSFEHMKWWTVLSSNALSAPPEYNMRLLQYLPRLLMQGKPWAHFWSGVAEEKNGGMRHLRFLFTPSSPKPLWHEEELERNEGAEKEISTKFWELHYRVQETTGWGGRYIFQVCLFSCCFLGNKSIKPSLFSGTSLKYSTPPIAESVVFCLIISRELFIVKHSKWQRLSIWAPFRFTLKFPGKSIWSSRYAFDVHVWFAGCYSTKGDLTC